MGYFGFGKVASLHCHSPSDYRRILRFFIATLLLFATLMKSWQLATAQYGGAVLISFLVYSTRKVIEFEILERIKRGFMRFEFCYISNSIVSPYFRKRFNNKKMFKIGFWIFTG